MNVAICLSGLIGSSRKYGQGKTIDYKKTKFFFEKNFSDKNINFFYFLHCWNKEIKDEIVEFYNPTDYLFETPLKIDNRLDYKQNTYISSNYSKKKVIELKKNYEEDNNIKFDLIILTRFDLLIYKQLNLHSLDKKKFYVVGPRTHHSKSCKCLFCDESNINHCLNDPLFIGSSSDIDKFSLAYDNLDQYGYESNHIITKKHILKMGLWERVDYIFNCPTNKYSQIWVLLEILGLFPKGMVPARIYETDIPLIRWVDKSYYLKTLDFFIFKLKIDIIYHYLIYKPILLIKFILKFKK